MQKVFNALAVGGFFLAIANSAVMGLVAVRGPAMAKKAISEVELRLTTVLFDKVNEGIEGAIPGMPSETGPAIPGVPRMP